MYANSDDCGSNASFFQFLHVHVWCIAQVIYVSDFIKKKSVPKKLTKGVPFLKKKKTIFPDFWPLCYYPYIICSSNNSFYLLGTF